MGPETIITCAVTGGAPIWPGSAVPIMPEKIADECLAAADAGAAIVHIHVRDPSTGKASMETSLYAQVVSQIRRRNADLIINLTTGPGARFVPDLTDPARGGPGTSLTHPAQRVAHVLDLRPEICSLDIATMNLGPSPIINTTTHLRTMASLIRDVGVKTELEVFELGHLEQAKQLIVEGFVTGTPLIQICLGAPGGTPASPRTMLGMHDHLPANCHWSAFGFGAQSFPMVAQAFLLGGHVRVGLEDNVHIREGTLAAGNAELVEHAARIVHNLGGTLASAQTARRLLGLK
ncbi:MAG TPA: 3-keto-5-aminohexanoate cleavage protein [Rhizomicrobium sp.]|nr:3-keto-5-aminohexanoate cleavage protein [Rhizomicrobium sp.]